MDSRERILTILNKKIPDRMGIFEHFWAETLEQYWSKQGYDYKDGEEYQYYFDYDIINCNPLWFEFDSFYCKKEIIQETDQWEIYKNGRGATVKLYKGKSSAPEHIDFEVKTFEKWKEYREPLLSLNEKRLGDIKIAKKKLKRARDANKFSVFGCISFFEQLRATIGDEHFLPAMALEPEWITDFCEVYLNSFKMHYDYLFTNAGIPDGFFLYEDMGYKTGLFCSPKMLEELIMPYQKELVSFFKGYGMKVIIHSCGNINEAIPYIIKCGFDCLQPMEVKAGCDLIEIAKKYGNQLSYMGNIDVRSFCSNDIETIKNEIIPKMDKIREMRIPYIFHTDHSIPPTVNFDVYKKTLDLVRENNCY